MWKANIVFGLFTSFVSAYILLHSYTLSYTIGFNVGPGYMPRWIGIVFLIASIFFILWNLIIRPEEAGDPFRVVELLKAAVIFGSLFGVLVVIERIGFVISMTIFMFIVLFFLEKKPIHYSLAFAVSGSLLVFGLFAVLFEVPLPRLVPRWI
jgi:putative tricarboxylic transport membrane protein